MRTTSNIIGFILCGVLLTLVILTGISDYQKSQLETDEVERGEFWEAEEFEGIISVDYTGTKHYMNHIVMQMSCEDWAGFLHFEFPNETYKISCEQFRELFKEFLITNESKTD